MDAETIVEARLIDQIFSSKGRVSLSIVMHEEIRGKVFGVVQIYSEGLIVYSICLGYNS